MSTTKTASKMKLQRLTEIRETVSQKKFPVPLSEMRARFMKLYTGAVNDVMREMCLTNQALPHGIVPLRDEMVICGEAFTIRSAKDPTLSGEMETRVKMLEMIYDGCVCVWNANGDDDASHWGEVMTAASKKRGCAGAIIDGGIRDTRQILEQDYPIFYRFRTSNGSMSRCKITALQQPVVVGTVIIKPGDIIFGDIDGAVCVPREIAYEVLTRAEAIKNNEEEIRDWVAEGLSADEIHSRGGYF
jgi:regulator of RNase E activity RraA